MVCVNFYPPFLAADPRTAGPDTVADHIAHVAGVAGIDHVGLGPDFVAEVMADLLPHWREAEEADGAWDIRTALPGIGGPRDFPRIAAELTDRGFDETARTKIMGANVAHLFHTTLGRPA